MTAQGQHAAQNHPSDLAQDIDAWPSLPEPIRAGILAMVNASVLSPTHRVSDKSDEKPRRTRKGRP